MDVSIIIVNYNTLSHIKKCIKSIIDFSELLKIEIIIVDNASVEKGIKELGGLFPEVKIIYNDNNNGFGSGCNIGVKQSSGKYCLIVNPDIEFRSNILKGMVDYMERDKECGAIGVVLEDESGNMIYTYNKFPGYFWEYIQAIGFGSNLIIKRLNKKLLNSKNEAVEVDWLIGAFILIKRSIYEKINGFDENFFLYYEDVDIQLRIKKAGYKIKCLKDYRVMHFERSSVRSYEGENLYFYHMNKSKILYMQKNFNSFKRIVITIMHITGIFFRIIFLYLRPKFFGKREQKFNQYKGMLNLYINSLI
ncbi:MAG: N-acetylglucosaminyl-diphospho-decaprenol L-rhamnosyltransferase [Ignavibacteria bacterium]|nr:N-acetylglucosaminyl-diphospho-decaprenol L-rhamnosyltransferase [Ignavibacteria bacterium]